MSNEPARYSADANLEREHEHDTHEADEPVTSAATRRQPAGKVVDVCPDGAVLVEVTPADFIHPEAYDELIELKAVRDAVIVRDHAPVLLKIQWRKE